MSESNTLACPRCTEEKIGLKVVHGICARRKSDGKHVYRRYRKCPKCNAKFRSEEELLYEIEKK